jgi:HEAT repeats
MRPKFLCALLLSALLVLGAAFYLKQHLGNAAVTPSHSSNFESTAASQPAKTIPPPVASNSRPTLTANNLNTPAATIMTPEQRQASIEAEADRLQELSMNNDPASLADILADLSSPEKEIRSAAIEAARQFGSPSAIPTLKTAAASTTDPEEQASLLAAADYLSLPSFGDPNVPTAMPLDQIQANNQRREQIAQKQKAASNQEPTPASPQSTSGN